MPAQPSTGEIKFACWAPNVGSGLVSGTIDRRADRGHDYDRELAVLAENNEAESLGRRVSQPAREPVSG